MPAAARREVEDTAEVAAELRSRSDPALVALLQARPDLVAPLPPDLDVLAARAVGRPSLLRALEDVDRSGLAVLETVALAEDGLLVPPGGPLPGAEAGVPVGLVVDALARAAEGADPDRAGPDGGGTGSAGPDDAADLVRASVDRLRRRLLLRDGGVPGCASCPGSARCSRPTSAGSAGPWRCSPSGSTATPRAWPPPPRSRLAARTP